ncbi:hypothetical protein WMF31_06975 [Sorangium sp. So ce1036]|uniref:hypothetical protein n=1 Tax=Sorangium sp. So ce1036 TaxID=3133328 RepID=UPI003F025B2F
MRGPLARAAVAAPVLAAVVLAASPARAEAPLPAAALPLAPAAPLAPPPAPLAPPLAPSPAPLAPPLVSPASAAPPPVQSTSQALTRDPDPWFGPDKALHFCASAALAGGGYALGALATEDVASRLAAGAVLALGAGLAKEALDAAGAGTPSWRDLAWDALGASVGLGLSVWFDLAVMPVSF